MVEQGVGVVEYLPLGDGLLAIVAAAIDGGLFAPRVSAGSSENCFRADVL
jgi:hypothetical protein